MTLTRSLAAMALAFSLAGLAATPAHADKKELVAKVLQLQQPGIEGLGNTLATNTANQVLQAAARTLGQLPADKREAVAKDLQAEARKFYEAVSPQLRSTALKLAPATLGTALEEKFSEDELKTLVTWLESPVSKKFQQTTGEVLQGLSQKLISDSRPQVEPKLKAYEQALRDKLVAAGVNLGDGAAAGKQGGAKK